MRSGLTSPRTLHFLTTHYYGGGLVEVECIYITNVQQWQYTYVMIAEHLDISHQNKHSTRPLINGLEMIGVQTYVLHDFVFYYYNKLTQSIMWTNMLRW